MAAAVLTELGAELPELQRSTEASVRVGKPSDPRRDLPYTSRARKVLELAMREARSLGHSYVGTEHILLGLLDPQSTPAVTVLTAAGVKLDDARSVAKRLRPVEHKRQPLAIGEPTARAAFVLALVALIVAIVALVLAVARIH